MAQPARATESPKAQKLRRATEEFESMLVSSWWQEMSKTFKDAAEDSDPGAETMETMGIQSMTLEMAKSGGLGLGRMLYHKLEPALDRVKSGTE